MAQLPPINQFNPTGDRYVSTRNHRTGYDIYRWDPPGGYTRIATLHDADAELAAIIARLHNERYPLRSEDFQMEKVNNV